MRSAIVFLALAACSQTEAVPKPEAAAQASSITGLYERAGIPGEPSRICIKADGKDNRFGLKSSWEGPRNCMMKGRVLQTGSVLTFMIDGAPACSLKANLRASELVLTQPRGAECSYYCGTSTDLGVGAFTKVGSTAADIGLAVDLVGDPLC